MFFTGQNRVSPSRWRDGSARIWPMRSWAWPTASGCATAALSICKRSRTWPRPTWLAIAIIPSPCGSSGLLLLFWDSAPPDRPAFAAEPSEQANRQRDRTPADDGQQYPYEDTGERRKRLVLALFAV